MLLLCLWCNIFNLLNEHDSLLLGGSWHLRLVSCDALDVYAMKPVCKLVNLFYQSILSLVMFTTCNKTQLTKQPLGQWLWLS